MSEKRVAPSFSIVIPTHERRDVVCDAVRALARVDYAGEIELIVVADGCTDGSAAAIGEIDVPFPVRIIEQPWGGAGRARNLGAASAKGEIILFLDDDMMCEPAVVAEHARMYERGADAVLGRILIDPESIAGFLTDDAATFAESMLPQQSATGLDVFTGQFSVRRNVFEDIGGFDEGFTSQSALGMEDADFGVTLLARHRLVVNAAAVSYQRYVMTPRENMRRQRLWAAADLRFARKHPRLSEELFRSRGAGRLVTQVIYRPLSRVPGLSQAMSAAAVRISEWALGTGLRSNRLLARFFAVSRAIAYWHAVAANGGVPHENR